MNVFKRETSDSAWKYVIDSFSQNKDFFINAIFILAGTILLCWPAFYNGYPLVFSDTGAYSRNLITAIQHRSLPIDRPLAYSFIFGRGLLFHSPWTPMIIQAFLVSFFIYAYTVPLLNKKIATPHARIVFIMIVLLLAIVSSIAWITTHLVPGVFGGVILLALAIPCTSRFQNISIRKKILFGLVIIWMTMTHGGFMLLVPMMVGVLGIVWLIARYLKKWARALQPTARALKNIAWKYLIAVAILPWGATFLLNVTISGEWQFVKGSFVFLTARMFEAGVAQQWLEEHCPANPHIFCPYKDVSFPTSNHFIWEAEGPLQQLGGWHVAVANAHPYKDINRAILTDVRYLTPFILDSINRSARLILKHDLLTTRTQRFFATFDSVADYRSSTQSKQRKGQLAAPLTTIASINAATSVVSLLILLCFFCIRRYYAHLPRYYRLSVLWGVSGVVLNAFIHATLSGGDPRYSTSVAWLLPFFALMCIVLYWISTRAKEQIR